MRKRSHSHSRKHCDMSSEKCRNQIPSNGILTPQEPSTWGLQLALDRSHAVVNIGCFTRKSECRLLSFRVIITYKRVPVHKNINKASERRGCVQLFLFIFYCCMGSHPVGATNNSAPGKLGPKLALLGHRSKWWCQELIPGPQTPGLNLMNMWNSAEGTTILSSHSENS